jgi:drug/metabolite transporter (DMT)-like permease
VTAAAAKTSRGSATAQGLGAIGLWALLAALTTLTRSIPPFQLAAMSFAIATIVGVVRARVVGEPLGAVLRTMPLGAWLLGVYGLLGFHVLYFVAVQNAPPLQANLINYSWPLLIVVLSGVLPATAGGLGRLRWWHVGGVVLGFGGVLLLLAGDATAWSTRGAALGHTAAVASSVVWATYSLWSRRYHAVPGSAVTGTCAVTALGALAGHLLLEKAVWPAEPLTWLAVLMQGIGPVGLAFFLWDQGMKHGDVRFLGAVSYAAPLLSTVILIGLGLAEGSARVWLAAGLVTAGAALAGIDVWRGRRASPGHI